MQFHKNWEFPKLINFINNRNFNNKNLWNFSMIFSQKSFPKILHISTIGSSENHDFLNTTNLKILNQFSAINFLKPIYYIFQSIKEKSWNFWFLKQNCSDKISSKKKISSIGILSPIYYLNQVPEKPITLLQLQPLIHRNSSNNSIRINNLNKDKFRSSEKFNRAALNFQNLVHIKSPIPHHNFTHDQSMYIEH